MCPPRADRPPAPASRARRGAQLRSWLLGHTREATDVRHQLWSEGAWTGLHSSNLPVPTGLTMPLTSRSLKFVSPANITVADSGASCIFFKTALSWFIRSWACSRVLSKWDVMRQSPIPDTLACNTTHRAGGYNQLGR